MPVHADYVYKLIPFDTTKLAAAIDALVEQLVPKHAVRARVAWMRADGFRELADLTPDELRALDGSAIADPFVEVAFRDTEDDHTRFRFHFLRSSFDIWIESASPAKADTVLTVVEKVLGLEALPEDEDSLAKGIAASNKTVFIGHGRSAVWRDLRDFLATDLALEWDEYNRVPTAGMSLSVVKGARHLVACSARGFFERRCSVTMRA